jgi:hypothetical protein
VRNKKALGRGCSGTTSVIEEGERGKSGRKLHPAWGTGPLEVRGRAR